MSHKVLVVLACVFLGVAGPAMADPADVVLELDGNSVVDGTACTAPNIPPGCMDDWDLLNGTGILPPNAGGSPGGSLVRDFISGSAIPTIFTGGQTKDPIDIPSWRWKAADTGPDKDTITNGYAAAYQSAAGHLILTFGADRFAVNGDANIGVWFFQDNVAPIGGTGGKFSGQHVNNDVFVVSAFTQGGGVSTITVYVWDDTCTNANVVKNPVTGQCAAANLRVRYDSATQGSCGGNTFGCAEVNNAPIDVSWPYLAKFGNNVTQIPAGGFYEAGIDLTDILPGQNGGTNLPCFTSWLVETRSSQTPSSVLKDFVSGAFPLCGLSATKSCAGDGEINPGGTSIHYIFDGTVSNTGVGGLGNITIVDSLPAGSTNVEFFRGSPAYPPADPGDPTTPASIVQCPAGAPVGAVCADLGSLDGGYVEKWSVEFDSTSLSPQNNAYAAGTGGSNLLVFSDPTQAVSCSTSPANSITITKNCGIPAGYPGNSGQNAFPGTQLVTFGGVAAVQVNFSGEVCNDGDTPLSGATVTDLPGAVITPATMPTLAPGDCAKYSGHYLPSGVTPGDLGVVAGRYGFADEVKVTGATASLGSSPGHDSTCTSDFTSDAQACGGATCNVCPASPAGLCGGN
jgi:hypothetical protein